MFHPQPMTEVELIVPANDILPVTKAIRGQGVFHQLDGSGLNAGAGGVSSEARASAGPWQEKATAYNALERRIQAVMQMIEMEEGRPPDNELDSLLDLDPARAQV